MNLLQKIKEKIDHSLLRRLPDADILIEAENRRGITRSGRISDRIIIDAKRLRAQNMRMLKQAIAAATDPEMPEWISLHELYDNMMIDNHLRSVIDSRIAYVQRHPFKLVSKNGEEDKDVSRLLERPWFEDLIRLSLMSRFQGRTLIEMFDVNPEGELQIVNEIPQSHFNAHSGLILKQPGDITGWNYKAPPLSNYYLQVGKDYDLGMFEKLSVVVLDKKLAMGSWLDYIEKYGVPSLFITADREDETHLRRLYEGASKFKSTHFMIGNGGDKFEIGSFSSAGIAPFDGLIQRVNEEISKAVLGGSALTDEKSFVGSSEIQYKLAKDRFESDKLLFKHLFNHEIKPRLINLSPVYAPLQNFEFQWDETESLDMKGIIDTVQKLGSVYNIDPEYVTEVTGIPILGIRENIALGSSFNQPAGGQDRKKTSGL